MFKRSMFLVVCFVMAISTVGVLIGCSEKETATNNSTPKPVAVDQKKQLASFVSQTNAVCKRLNREQKMITKRYAVDLADEVAPNRPGGVRELTEATPKEIATINRKGRTFNEKTRAASERAYAQIGKFDVPADLKSSVELWMSESKRALPKLTDKTFEVKDGQVYAGGSEKQTQRQRRADVFAALLGIGQCSDSYLTGQQTRKASKTDPQTKNQRDRKGNYIWESIGTPASLVSRLFLDGDSYLSEAQNSVDKGSSAAASSAEVRGVVAANQLKTEGAGKLKLGGIADSSLGQCYAKYAKRALKRELVGSFVLIERTEVSPKLAYIQDGSESVNARMLLKGQLLPDPDAKPNDPFTDALWIAARVARINELGVWKACPQEAAKLGDF